jgi:uncharacterized protein YbjQ (UPF0145 family)
MGDMINLLIFIGLILLGFVAGMIAEKRHYRSIESREKAYLDLPAMTMKRVDFPIERIKSVEMVYGSAVISIDYFKRILASLRNIFGGSVKSYESLIDRARREAMLRMKEMAVGSTVIINVRIETAAIGKRANKKGVGCLEAIAYGTAITLEE